MSVRFELTPFSSFYTSSFFFKCVTQVCAFKKQNILSVCTFNSFFSLALASVAAAAGGAVGAVAGVAVATAAAYGAVQYVNAL